MPLTAENAIRSIHLAIALGASSTAFLIGSSVIYRSESLAHLMVWTGLASYVCGVLGILIRARVPHVVPSLMIALGGVSLLLLDVWNRLRLAHLRRPLLYGSTTLVLVVVPLAFSLWLPGLHIGIALALCGLTLVAIQAEMPRGDLGYLALTAFFGVWLKGFDRALCLELPTLTLWFGLAVGLYNLILLGVVEVLRARLGWERYNPLLLEAVVNRPRTRMFAALIPTFVIVASFLADSMAWMNVDAIRWCGFLLILAAAGLLWSSRFVRDAVLVYVGLWHAVAGLACVSDSLHVWNSDARQVGWLALTLALIALALWIASLAARRSRLGDIYWVPCLNTALGLTAVVFVLAVNARLMAREAFALSTLALVLDSLVCLLIATTRRWPELIYATVASFVAASYMILLSWEHPDPKMAYVLGLNAVIEGLVVWVLGDICRRLKNPWPQACALPLFHSALILTTLAIPPAYQSPVTMSLVAVSFLLTVKSLPDAAWIYPALAAVGAAMYFPWLAHLTRVDQIVACLVFAYVSWTLGLLVRRGKATLTGLFGLEQLDYEFPMFNVAGILGLAALLCKFDGQFEYAAQWTAQCWVPLSIAPLSFGMIRAYPRREFVHVSLLFLVWGTVSLVAPSLHDVHFLILGLVVCSLGLQVLDLCIRPAESTLWDRVAIPDMKLGGIIRGWWFLLGLCGLSAGVMLEAAAMAGAMTAAPGVIDPLDWWVITGSLVLAATQIALATRDRDLLAGLRPEGVVIGLELTGVALLWWLGVAGSPLRSWHTGYWNMQPEEYYPLVTGLAGLILADWNSRPGRRANPAGTIDPPRAAEAGMIRLLFPVLLLSMLAPVFTFGRESATTVATLVCVALALGLWAIRQEQYWAAYLAGLAWTLAGLVGGLVAGPQWGWTGSDPRAMSAAVGELVAVGVLAGIAGWFRHQGAGLEREKALSAAGSSSTRTGFALVLEHVAFLGSLAVAGLVAQAANHPVAAISELGLASIGTLLALSLFYLLLTARWRAEWLVYLAQACLVCAYIEYRRVAPLSAAADGAVLVLFAFVDLGTAEVLERFQLTLFARPHALCFARLAGSSPGPPARCRGAERWHRVSVAGRRHVLRGRRRTMQWKTLGYAAGVLYNSALWVLWGKMGWQLSRPYPVLLRAGRTLGDPLRRDHPPRAAGKPSTASDRRD